MFCVHSSQFRLRVGFAYSNSAARAMSEFGNRFAGKAVISGKCPLSCIDRDEIGA